MTEPLSSEDSTRAGLPPAPLPPQEEAEFVYQPLSGWAIASFAIGGLFALVVAVSGLVGLFQGAPVFFPLWIMAVPIGGVILALIGLEHVKNSEGTRAGSKLAAVGLWISLLSGLSYFSYYYFTGLALQSQANDFLLEPGEDSGFFVYLREQGLANPKALNAAFLLTRPATDRPRDIDPANELKMRQLYDKSNKEGMPGELTLFKEGLFARAFFGDLGKDATITPLAVQDWKYEKHSYKIVRPYRIATREVVMEVVMTIQSTEAEATGQSRKWFVNMMETYPLSKQPTPLGQGVRFLRSQAQRRLEMWLQGLNDGHSTDVLSKKEIPLLQAVGQQEKDREIVALAVQAFTSTEKKRLQNPQVPARDDDIGKWELDPQTGKVRIYQYFRFGLPAPSAGPALGTVHAYAVLETRRGDIKLDESTSRSPAPDWEVRQVVLLQVARTPEQRKGAP